MQSMSTIRRNAAARDAVGVYLIQLGVEHVTAADVVHRLPGKLAHRLAGQLESFLSVEYDATAAGKPYAIALQELRDAQDNT